MVRLKFLLLYKMCKIYIMYYIHIHGTACEQQNNNKNNNNGQQQKIKGKERVLV